MSKYSEYMPTAFSKVDGKVLEKYHWKGLNLWKCFLDILYPPFCVGCGADGLWACDTCVRGMKFLGEQVCPVCRHDETGGFLCSECFAKDEFFLTGLWAGVRYREAEIESRLIHTLKYDFVTDIVPTVCEIMVNALPDIDVDEFVLSYVPLHRKRYRWRGFNQAQLMAEYIGKALDMEVVELLERINFSKPQMELGRDERVENVKDAFCVKRSDLPKKVILIDDVATTLSTLNECARVLSDAGVEEVFGFVFARAV
ncbi:ComF family protein [Candidatus Peregrinibacteria bacterium]|nr:ComF family protein [Candidatus Peregrinibacteria bacterium]